MKKNILTTEIKKDIVRLRNDAITKNIEKHYKDNVTCGYTLTVLACRSFRKGEVLFKEFISQFGKDIYNIEKDRILNSRITEIETKFYEDNTEEINSLPKSHKNNKKILSNFIRDGILYGFITAGEIVCNIMSSKDLEDVSVG